MPFAARHVGEQAPMRLQHSNLVLLVTSLSKHGGVAQKNCGRLLNLSVFGIGEFNTYITVLYCHCFCLHLTMFY